MRDDRRNIIIEMTSEYSLNIIKFVESLEERKKYVVAKQIIRCATSIGANACEAQNAESKADFIHKFKIAAKEADETQYWLNICSTSSDYPTPPPELLTSLNSIISVISKIISTSKRTLP